MTADDGAASEQTSHGAARALPLAVAGLAGAPAVLGVVKTLAEAGTGESFSLADAAYFAGCVALGGIIGLFWGAMAAGLVTWVMTDALGLEENDGILFGTLFLVFGLGLTAGFMLAGDPNQGSPGFFRFLGIACVVGAGAWYAHHKSTSH